MKLLSLLVVMGMFVPACTCGGSAPASDDETAPDDAPAHHKYDAPPDADDGRPRPHKDFPSARVGGHRGSCSRLRGSPTW